mmetsp:Transcript_1081/g.4285  ORF Transcript_1081/g.4285 Transcript_1081/m.4285 type:complete len:210 (-) Transcript_1081:1738-2367(-)
MSTCPAASALSAIALSHSPISLVSAGTTSHERRTTPGMRPFLSFSCASSSIHSFEPTYASTATKTSSNGLVSKAHSSFQPSTSMATIAHAGTPAALRRASCAANACDTCAAASESKRFHACRHAAGCRSTTDASTPFHASPEHAPVSPRASAEVARVIASSDSALVALVSRRRRAMIERAFAAERRAASATLATSSEAPQVRGKPRSSR